MGPAYVYRGCEGFFLTAAWERQYDGAWRARLAVEHAQMIESCTVTPSSLWVTLAFLSARAVWLVANVLQGLVLRHQKGGG